MVSILEVAPMGRRLLGVKRVAAKLDRSTRWIWSALAAGRFPAPVRLGTRGVRWIEAEIDQWIDALALDRAPVITGSR